VEPRPGGSERVLSTHTPHPTRLSFFFSFVRSRPSFSWPLKGLLDFSWPLDRSNFVKSLAWREDRGCARARTHATHFQCWPWRGLSFLRLKVDAPFQNEDLSFLLHSKSKSCPLLSEKLYVALLLHAHASPRLRAVAPCSQKGKWMCRQAVTKT